MRCTMPMRAARLTRFLAILLLLGMSAAPAASAATFHLPLLPPASDAFREGVVRIVNHSDEPGQIAVSAVDDTGSVFGPIVVPIEAGQAIEFSSTDLEQGNADKGIAAGIGAGQGDWRVVLETALEIEPLAYSRTSTGFTDRLDRVVPRRSFYRRVPLPAPGPALPDGARLRLVNASNAATDVVIFGIDDSAQLAPGLVSVTLPGGGARTIDALTLEQGASGLDGQLGDGRGDWRLLVFAARPIDAMALLDSPSGPLANLSAASANDGEILLFPPADDAKRSGLLRIASRTGAGQIRIHGIDDAGRSHGPAVVNLEEGQTVVLDSTDLELGNASNGLTIGLGDGEGDWRLRLENPLELDVSAYIRTGDGFLTAVRDADARADSRHYIPRFNPASQLRSTSRLRLINPTDVPAAVEIIAWDDGGTAAPEGAVALTLEPGAATSLDAAALERGALGLNGRFGEGQGKWRVALRSDRDIRVMNLAESVAGHLTNIGVSPALAYFPEECFDGEDADGDGIADACETGAPPALLRTAGCVDGRYVEDPANNPGLVGDCRALVEIANALARAGELPADHALVQWGTDAAMKLSAWDGVGVAGGRVTSLDLSGSRAQPGELVGAIPAELAGLGELTRLDLSYNRLTGPIPEELGDLSRLTHLNLSHNGLSGELPAALGLLADLRELDIEGNPLTGAAPWIYRERLERDGLVLLYGGTGIVGLAPPPRRVNPIFSDDPADNGNASHRSVAFYQGPLVWERDRGEEAVEHQQPLLGRWAVLVVRIEHEIPVAPVVEARVSDAVGAAPDATLDEAAPPRTVSAGAGRWLTEYLFDLPGALNRAGTRIVPVIDPDDAMAETDERDNLGEPILLYGATPPRLRITFLPVQFEGREPPALDAALLMRGIRAFWPVADDFEAIVGPALESDAANQYELLAEVRALWNAEADPDEFYYGIFAQPWTGGRGVAYRPGRVAVSEWSEFDTIPHEFGHNLDLRHPPGCEVRYPNRRYPYPDGGLGPHPVWDANWRRLVTAADTQYADVMSYCGSQQLVSDYHYREAWKDWRSTGPARPASAAPPPFRLSRQLSGGSASGPGQPSATQNAVSDPERGGALALSGRIDADGRWSLTQAQATDKAPRAPAPSGPYTLALFDADGQALYREPLSADAMGHGSEAGWAARVPVPSRPAQQLAILDARGVVVLRVTLPALRATPPDLR